MSATAHRPTPTIPDEAIRRDAEHASRILARLAGQDRVRVEAASDDGAPLTFVLPSSAIRLLTDVMALLAQGQAVTVFPQEADLTTQEAADMLNVSRPHLVKLIEQGAIACHKVGTHRRVRLEDLMRYRAEADARQRQAAAELAAEGQRLGMGY
ncbi:MAG: helix-turn-helix domain-containing protein [Acetobacteraceae bacterium]|nr:helix-turn-helix domain-containing protein [Acetobacteraceae bacterium]